VRGSVLAAIALAVVAVTGAKGFDVNSTPRRSTDLPPPRPDDAAVREELEAARHARTVAAYDLFLARHGDHRLAAIAQRERAALLTPRQ
jgi:hypothetical protein